VADAAGKFAQFGLFIIMNAINVSLPVTAINWIDVFWRASFLKWCHWVLSD
jgi:hypothetical protein